jgi:hypothetical protein
MKMLFIFLALNAEMSPFGDVNDVELWEKPINV